MIDIPTSLALIVASLVIGFIVGTIVEDWLTPATLEQRLINPRAAIPAPGNPHAVDSPDWYEFNTGHEAGLLDGHRLTARELLRDFNHHMMKNAIESRDDPFECGWIHAARPAYQLVWRKAARENGFAH